MTDESRTTKQIMTDTNRPMDVSAADENYVLCAYEDLDLNCAHGTYCENEWNEENPSQVGRIIGYFSNAGEAVDEYRDDLKCSEADYMRLICCGDSENVVLVEKRSGPQHAAIVFPPAP